jgi:hypothetical protein
MDTQKTITVRKVERDGHGTLHSDWTTHVINSTHTLQEVVQEICPLFPRNCIQVWVTGVRRTLWSRIGNDDWDDEAQDFLNTDQYDRISEGDELEVVVSQIKPGGPFDAWTDPTPGGPKGSRMLALLRQLQNL